MIELLTRLPGVGCNCGGNACGRSPAVGRRGHVSPATRTGADRSESLVLNAMSECFSGRPSRGGGALCADRRGTGIPRKARRPQ